MIGVGKSVKVNLGVNKKSYLSEVEETKKVVLCLPLETRRIVIDKAIKNKSLVSTFA
jgi:hypothetical protein